jgi:hypothetical protein
MASVSFYTDRVKAAALAAILAVCGAGCGAVLFFANARPSERITALSVTLLFGWGLCLALARFFDRRAALTIDDWGIRDRRMKIGAPWSSILAVRLWVQELDAAKSPWIALEVRDVEAVRTLPRFWAGWRRRTLERWGRPPVALNVQGLTGTAQDVLAAIARFRPDLAAR